MKNSNFQISKELVDSFIEQAVKYGIDGVSVLEAARNAHIDVAQVLANRIGKKEIIAAYQRDLTIIMLSEMEKEVNHQGDFTDESTIRDDLLGVLLARFDAMEEHRDFWGLFFSKNGKPKPALILLNCSGVAASSSALKYVGFPTSGIKRDVSALALWGIFASVIPTWLNDDANGEKTMAELDARLQKAGQLFKIIDKPSFYARQTKEAVSVLTMPAKKIICNIVKNSNRSFKVQTDEN